MSVLILMQPNRICFALDYSGLLTLTKSIKDAGQKASSQRTAPVNTFCVGQTLEVQGMMIEVDHGGRGPD